MSEQSHLNIRIQWWVLIIGVLLMSVKFLAYYITHSTAILTDALESIINVIAGMMGLYSLKLSAKPRDDKHPYGHGKIEFLTSGLEGGMIILAGGYIMAKSVYGFFHPHSLSSLDMGLLLASAAGLVNYIMGSYIERKGKMQHTLVLEAGGKHLKSDAYSSAAMLSGLCIIWITGEVWLDDVIAIAFGSFIFLVGIKMVRKSVGGMMDEADMKLINELVDIINKHRKDNWIDVHNFRIITYGQKLHIDCHLTMPWYKTLKEIHEETEEFERLLDQRFGRKIEFFIHPEHCLPESCHICLIKDCDVRQHPFEKQINWEPNHFFPNKQHDIQT